MIVTNKLTQPGGVKRVVLQPDTIEVVMVGGEVRNYQLSSAAPSNRPHRTYVGVYPKEVSNGNVQM